MLFNIFETVKLDDKHEIIRGCLPTNLIPDNDTFEKIWCLHPEEFHDVKIMDKLIKTPRWQQAYNKDYVYTGSKNNALAVPQILNPYWIWAKEKIDERLNGLLLNWYDGKLGHYIGKHRDSTTGMIFGAPIVTISLGEERKFRIRPWKGEGYTDFQADHCSVFIIPYDTNQAYTHEVPKSKKYKDRRISLTLRAFE